MMMTRFYPNPNPAFLIPPHFPFPIRTPIQTPPLCQIRVSASASFDAAKRPHSRRREDEQRRWARRSRSGRRRRRRRSAAACKSTEPASGGPSRRTRSSARCYRLAPTSTSRYLPCNLCRRSPCTQPRWSQPSASSRSYHRNPQLPTRSYGAFCDVPCCRLASERAALSPLHLCRSVSCVVFLGCLAAPPAAVFRRQQIRDMEGEILGLGN